ncbi:MAG: virulence factor [Actinobacteria bacterium]|jgi:Virulence factor|nr:virulence factor [Actinomycetota bacterium]
MPRGSNEVIVIMWRDIPAQVNAQAGRERKQVQLSDKFQRAIDRAKRKAHIYTADEDIAQWRRISLPLVGDLAEAAQREADRLDGEYSRERLGRLAFAGGYEADVDNSAISTDALLALEELEENE